MKLVTLAILAAFALTACHGSARVDGPGYDVEVESDSYHHHTGARNFCPPGQAKKGRCH